MENPEEPPPYSAAVRNANHHPSKPPAPRLRHHSLTLLFLAVYLVFLVLLWAVTCVLDVRPKLTALSGSYNGIQGQYTWDDLAKVGKWMQAIPVLNAIAAIMTVPVLSAMLGHAAVVYVQRRQDAGRTVNLRELLALADCTWTSVPGDRRLKHGFEVVATALVALSVVIPPLQSLLVTTSTIQVPTCHDTYRDNNAGHECARSVSKNTYVSVGLDPEPADMTYMPLAEMVAQVGPKAGTVNRLDSLAHAWVDTTYANISGELQAGWNDYSRLHLDGRYDWNWYPQTNDSISVNIDSLADGWPPESLPAAWENRSSIPTHYGFVAPGPLTSSLIVMLGNSTWFSIAAGLDSRNASNNADAIVTELCLPGASLPLARLGYHGSQSSKEYLFNAALQDCTEYATWALREDQTFVTMLVGRIVADWFAALNGSSGWDAMETTMYFANEAAMVSTAKAGSSNYASRVIYTATGTTVTKPSVSLAGKIAISALLGIQVLALLVLAGFIQATRTLGWRFDAATMVVVGAQLQDAIIGGAVLQLGRMDREARKKLERVDTKAAFARGGWRVLRMRR